MKQAIPLQIPKPQKNAEVSPREKARTERDFDLKKASDRAKAMYVAHCIYMYRNGDAHFTPRKIVISSKRFKNFEQV